jgi:hypothetical protein
MAIRGHDVEIAISMRKGYDNGMKATAQVCESNMSVSVILYVLPTIGRKQGGEQ